MAETGGTQRKDAVLQTSRALRTDIEAGRYRHGEKLATTRELAKTYGTSVATVSRALKELAREQLVVVRPSIGAFVNLPGATATASDARGPLTITVVGGYAGSGKTEVGLIVARLTGWALLDKDPMTRSLAEALLVALGQSKDDRQSETYLTMVRPAEYDALREVMLQNVQAGVSVILNAPFLRELGNEAWCQRLQADADALGARLRVIWVRTDLESMRIYLDRRGAARDTHKLENWPTYSAGVNLEFAPRLPHVIVDNSIQDPPLQKQVENVLERWGVPVAAR